MICAAQTYWSEGRKKETERNERKKIVRGIRIRYDDST